MLFTRLSHVYLRCFVLLALFGFFLSSFVCRAASLVHMYATILPLEFLIDLLFVVATLSSRWTKRDLFWKRTDRAALSSRTSFAEWKRKHETEQNTDGE